MKQQLLAHIRHIEQQLAALEAAPPADAADSAARGGQRERLRALLAYHLAQTQAFQHERLAHLLVTLFFAFLLLAVMVGALLWPVWQLLAVTGIVTLVEIFYLRHYYTLENNVQKLYPLTKRLHELIEK